MDEYEQRVADAMERLGLPYIGPDLGKKSGKCHYCGIGHSDFSICTPVGMRYFHTDCHRSQIDKDISVVANEDN